MTNPNTPDDPHRAFNNVVLGGARSPDNARQAYEAMRDGWDLPETVIGDGRSGIPVTRFAQALYESHQQYAGDPEQETLAEQLYGTRHPFLAASLVGPEYEEGGGVRDVDRVIDHTRDATPDGERGLVDTSVVKSASPVEVDPAIVDIQRSQAPVLDIIPTVAQAGFTADFNVFDGRTLQDYFMSESDAADLTDNTGSDFSLSNDTQDMKIAATLLNISDFSQRAEESLNYMDLMDTTVGQIMAEWFNVTAKTFFYGDADTTTGSGEHEDGNGFDGLAAFADDGSNVTDKTGVSSGYLEDMLDYLTSQTQSSGLTFGTARFLVSPKFYNEIYDEVTPVVRIDGYDADVEYGPQGLAIGHERGSVPITPCDNIRDYQSESDGVGSNSTNGDVFLYDERTVQFRALAPMSTIPLGRTGLSDKAALFYYGALIDKSQGNHTHRLRYGSV